MNNPSDLAWYPVHRALGRRLIHDEEHPKFYLDCDFIVTGPEPEVIQAVDKAREEFRLDLVLVKELDLDNIMKPFVGTGPEFPWFSGMDRKHRLVMQLYRTDVPGPPRKPDLSQVKALVNRIRGGPYGKNVYADLDYLLDGVSGDPWTGEGSPWTGEGSPWTREGNSWTVEGRPWTGEGSPWTGEGSPWTGEGSPRVREDSPWNVKVKSKSDQDGPAKVRNAFSAQWAFDSETGGIGLIQGQERRVPYDGQDVRVGIFDTSPESRPRRRRYDWVDPPLSLSIEGLDPLSDAYGTSDEVDDLIRTPWVTENHGLFVAGLIHGVAPKSDIRLYRVLGGERTGDLFTLNYALYSFIEQVLEDRGKLKGAVINLSLGFDPELLESYSPGEPARLDLAPVSLHALLTAAHRNGVVIAAAAGNRKEGKTHAPAQNPAFSPDCLAVEASNCQGSPSDFSRIGIVRAPGGCVPGGQCRGTHQEELASQWLTSVVWRPPRLAKWFIAAAEWLINRDPVSADSLSKRLSLPPGYAYAAGTSFSTPLVSGLAALMFDAGARGPSGNREWIAAKVVYECIQASMKENGGVIHVPTAIEKALASLGRKEETPPPKPSL